jgi:hypothetical protein
LYQELDSANSLVKNFDQTKKNVDKRIVFEELSRQLIIFNQHLKEYDLDLKMNKGSRTDYDIIRTKS